MFHCRRAFALALLLLSPRLVAAQGTATPKEPPVTAGWQDGFYIQSQNGDYRVQFGVLMHIDGRFAIDDVAESINDTFVVRRLRPSLRGRFARRFEFFVNPDFGLGTLVLQDAYVDTVFSPAFRLRIGKAKSPFGFERLQVVGNMLFFERASPTAIAPNRDVGVQVLGETLGGRLSYLGGVVNGVSDGSSSDLDNGDAKDFVGRIVLKPFAASKGSALQELMLGFSASAGSQSGAAALPTFRTASLQQPYFTYLGAQADGVRTRYSPHAAYYHKGFGSWFEYVHSELPVRKDGVVDDVAHDAWQIAGSFMLTGEHPSDGSAPVRPKANFDFGNGHYGAVQLAARFHALTVDDRAFEHGFVAPGSSRKVQAWTVGANWYLTPNFRYVFNFERSVFDDNADGARPPENAVVFRTQVYF
jgi:phosphate-selective porin OprO/OprP